MEIVTTLNFEADTEELINQTIVDGGDVYADVEITAKYGGIQIDVDDFTDEEEEELTGTIMATIKDGNCFITLDYVSSSSFDYQEEPEYWIDSIELQ